MLDLRLKLAAQKNWSQHFHDNVELNIKGETGNYSNVHAEIYLKEFFLKSMNLSALNMPTKEVPMKV